MDKPVKKRGFETASIQLDLRAISAAEKGVIQGAPLHACKLSCLSPMGICTPQQHVNR